MLLRILLCAAACLALVSGLSDGIHDIESFYKFRPAPRRLKGGGTIEDEFENAPPGDMMGELAGGKEGPVEERETSFWLKNAENDLVRVKLNEEIIKQAKNVIQFIGDGMSISTLTATRVYKGQLSGKKTGEEEQLSFEKFPYAGLSKTYCTNGQVPDSACTATAYHCGVKTNIGNIGVNAQVTFKNCTQSNDPANHVDSYSTWAQKAGKSAGLVTTTTVTHASPSAAYAHVGNRMWECDSDVETDGLDPVGCQDIASQLIYNLPGKYFNVILGGGRGKFLPKETLDEYGNPGMRSDGDNLIEKWKRLHPEGKYVSNRDQLLNTNYNETQRLLGLFQPSHMHFHLDANEKEQPTLAEMTAAAINVLKNNPNGYSLFVEGGLIDHAHHLTWAHKALDECLELSKAVETAVNLTNPYETLIVVSSDHSHPMDIVGYPERGNKILGLNEAGLDANGLKYPVINYAAGPNRHLDDFGKRIDLTDLINEPNFQYPGGIPTAIVGNHAGDDVGIFAYGPFAHLLTGVKEQHMIPHVMAYAACIGDGRTFCKDSNANAPPATPSRGVPMDRVVVGRRP